MASKSKHTALLKVLAAAAWADGRIDVEEANWIKERALRAGLSIHDLTEVEAILETPTPYDRCETLTRELLERLTTPGDRKEVLDEVEALFRADGSFDESEARLLESLRGAMDAATTLDGFLGRVTSVFSGVFGAKKSPAQDESGPGGVLKARLDAVSDGGWRHEISDAEVHQHLMYAAVLGKVADVEDGKAPEELEAVKKALEQRRGLDAPLVDWIVRTVAETAHAGMDRQYLLSEFNRVADMERRRDLLDAAFSIAAADGSISDDEMEELRLVSNFLWIDPRDYNAIRRRWKF